MYLQTLRPSCLPSCAPGQTSFLPFGACLAARPIRKDRVYAEWMRIRCAGIDWQQARVAQGGCIKLAGLIAHGTSRPLQEASPRGLSKAPLQGPSRKDPAISSIPRALVASTTSRLMASSDMVNKNLLRYSNVPTEYADIPAPPLGHVLFRQRSSAGVVVFCLCSCLADVPLLTGA